MLVHEQAITRLDASQVVYVRFSLGGHIRLIEQLMAERDTSYAAVDVYIDSNFYIGGATYRFELLTFIQLFGPIVDPDAFHPSSKNYLFESVVLHSTT